MKTLFFCLLIFLSQIASAQTTVDVSKDDVNAIQFFKVVGGIPISKTKFTKLVEGSPYYTDNWMKGVVVMSEGWQYPDILVKLNLLDNEVIYKDKKGSELVATSPIKRLILTDTIKKETFTFINSRYIINSARDVNVWYQVLLEGNASVVKRSGKSIKENVPYGSGLIEQTITDNPKYFILHNDKLSPVKKASDIPDVLSDKKNELLKYIKEKKISGKSDEQFIEIVHYYNSLK